MKHPRTHRWYPTVAQRDAPEPEGSLEFRVPPGPPAPVEEIDAAAREALKGWPVVRFRVIGELRRSVSFGRSPGPRLHGIVAGAVDAALCTCGSRCTQRSCPAHILLGRHEVGAGSGIGDPWAPIALRVAGAAVGKVLRGTDTRIEIILAGRSALEAVKLVDALAGDRDGDIEWRTIQYLQGDEGSEPRWRAAKGVASETMLLPLDRVDEPRFRSRRLTLGFSSPTSLSLPGERGLPHASFPLVLDRAGRSLATWMHRTGHRGPRLPGEDLLRAARDVETAADHTRVIELDARSLSGDLEGPEQVTALMGAVTWKGDFAPFQRVLRAMHYLGVGPARAHGFGEVEVR